MDDGTLHGFSRDEMAKDRLAHGYALTVHRSQGDTVDVAHRLEDGGGRELAYVSMSRARQRTVVHVVADDLEQAREDLTRDWAAERRPRWAIDSGTPAVHPLEVERHSGAPAPMRAALRRARLEAERRAVLRAVPPDVNPELRRVNQELRSLKEQRQHVEAGSGRLDDPDLARAARDLIVARHEAQQAERFSEDRTASWRMRRQWRHEATSWREVEAAARATYEHLAEPEIARLDECIDQLSDRCDELRSRAGERASWLAEHPEIGRRLKHLDRELTDLDAQAHAEREFSQLIARTVATPLRPDLGPELAPGRGAGIDLGMDLGL